MLNYITARSPQGAQRVQARLRTLTELLLAHPYVGRPTNDPTVRRLKLTPYPYLVFYEVSEDSVIIHAIRHAARDPSDLPGAGA